MVNAKETLQAVFQEIFDDTNIKIFDEMAAKDIEDWDSLNHIRLVIAIEKKFKIRFKTGEVAAIENVGQMIKLIHAKIGHT